MREDEARRALVNAQRAYDAARAALGRARGEGVDSARARLAVAEQGLRDAGATLRATRRPGGPAGTRGA
jgi:multidrug resistance efflux pump